MSSWLCDKVARCSGDKEMGCGGGACTVCNIETGRWGEKATSRQGDKGTRWLGDMMKGRQGLPAQEESLPEAILCFVCVVRLWLSRLCCVFCLFWRVCVCWLFCLVCLGCLVCVVFVVWRLLCHFWCHVFLSCQSCLLCACLLCLCCLYSLASFGLVCFVLFDFRRCVLWFCWLMRLFCECCLLSSVSCV